MQCWMEMLLKIQMQRSIINRSACWSFLFNPWIENKTLYYICLQYEYLKATRQVHLISLDAVMLENDIKNTYFAGTMSVLVQFLCHNKQTNDFRVPNSHLAMGPLSVAFQTVQRSEMEKNILLTFREDQLF